MEFRYSLEHINEQERWIYISSDSNLDCEETDAFVFLLKKIARDIGGNIIPAGITQYKIDTDRLKLIFQWDGVFGISIIYPERENLEQVINFIRQYCVG